MQVKQPPGHASLDWVQPIAGCDVLELHEYRPRMRLDHMSDGAASHVGCLKTHDGDLRCGAPHPHDRGYGRQGGVSAQHRERTEGSLAPDHGGCNRFPVRKAEHEGDGAAMGKVNMVSSISRLRYHDVLFKR